MSVSHLLSDACPPEWCKVRAHRIHSCTDLQFDGSLIGEISLNGNIPHGAPRTFLHTNSVNTINWKTFTKEDIPAGVNGDYLQTIGGQVEWAFPTFGPSSITPGNPNQAFVTDPTGSFAYWSDNINLPGYLTVGGTIDLLGNMQFNGVSGSSGQFLKKTSGTTQEFATLDPSDIPGLGTPGQVLATNAFGTAGEWTSSLSLPGSLTVNGITTLNNTTNLTGDLRFNNIPGSVGQYLKKTGAATQAFSNILPADMTAGSDYNVLTSFSGTAQWYPQPQIKRVIYGTYFTAQNINAAVGPSALTFDTSPFTNIASSTTTPIVGISQPSNTQFNIGNINNYVITIAGYIDAASTGLGNSIVTLSLEVDGTERQDAVLVCNGNYSFSGSFPPIAFSAGQVIRVLARRVTGTGTLNTNASGSALPNFASTISIISL